MLVVAVVILLLPINISSPLVVLNMNPPTLTPELMVLATSTRPRLVLRFLAGNMFVHPLSFLTAFQATNEEDEDTLKKSLATYGPLSICVDAEYWQDYAGGVMGAWQCAWINRLDHCVQLVGYNMDASTPYWLVRNSWGTDWGEKGYIRLGYGYCLMASTTYFFQRQRLWFDQRGYLRCCVNRINKPMISCKLLICSNTDTTFNYHLL